jgi:hypothetical protein
MHNSIIAEPWSDVNRRWPIQVQTWPIQVWSTATERLRNNDGNNVCGDQGKKEPQEGGPLSGGRY